MYLWVVTLRRDDRSIHNQRERIGWCFSHGALYSVLAAELTLEKSRMSTEANSCATMEFLSLCMELIMEFATLSMEFASRELDYYSHSQSRVSGYASQGLFVLDWYPFEELQNVSCNSASTLTFLQKLQVGSDGAALGRGVWGRTPLWHYVCHNNTAAGRGIEEVAEVSAVWAWGKARQPVTECWGKVVGESVRT